MARYPNASWRPFPPVTRPKMTRYDIVVLHTMVGTLAGTEAYFKSGGGYNGVHSHFGLGDKGQMWQWQDTAFRDACQLEGNGRAISIETQDTKGVFPPWTGSNVPAWTPEQVNSLAEFLAWCHKTHGIPLKTVPDSKPTSRGIAYHRQGINPWRVSGGELWSNSQGKVCPGDRRIAQIPAIIEKAKVLIGEDMPAPYETANIYAQVLLFRNMDRAEWEKYHKDKTRDQLFDAFANAQERKDWLAKNVNPPSGEAQKKLASAKTKAQDIINL